jgi:hypothetical protein
MSAALKKAGYNKEHDEFGPKIYLKWIDERYAFGFTIYKCPQDPYPTTGAGLLDLQLGLTLGEIEQTADMGIYHLSVDKELYNEIFFEQKQDADWLIKAINTLEAQIACFTQNTELIIEEDKQYIQEFKDPPYFYNDTLKIGRFGYIYYGLVFRLVENGSLSRDEIELAISYATEIKANTKDFQFKLGLLKKYLDSNEAWE